MDEIITLIVKILSAILAIGIAFIIPKATAWLTERVGAMQAEKIMTLVKTFVQSAEQLYWNKTGLERKDYVLENLAKLGYDLTDEINAYIESEVFRVHSEESHE